MGSPPVGSKTSSCCASSIRHRITMPTAWQYGSVSTKNTFFSRNLGGCAGGCRLRARTRGRTELDLRIALRGHVLDDPEEFRRAAVVDEVADRARFVAGD